MCEAQSNRRGSGNRAKLWLLVCAAVLPGPVLAAESYEVPRTYFGQPDLQGTWTNATITTLERPEEYDALVVSDDQAQQSARQQEAFLEANDNPEKVDGQLQEANDPGGYNSFWIDVGEQLMQIDGEYRSSIIVDPADGEVPYTWRGRWEFMKAILQFSRYDGPEIRFLGERCIVGFGSTGGPPMLPVLYNNNYQIVQNKDHVLIMVEMNHDVRTVRLNSEQVPADVKLWLGDSIGWWEGDTLVVETTNFHPGQSFRAAIKHQLYASENLKVTERFTRVSEDAILYQFTMHDPEIYSQDWTGEMLMRSTQDKIYEYACHEGNYALPGILKGARIAEMEGEGGGFFATLAKWLHD